VLLAELRAQIALLQAQDGKGFIAGEDHVAICSHRPRCRTNWQDRADVAHLKALERRWFAKIPGQQVLA